MKKHLRIVLRYFQVHLSAALEYRSAFISQAAGMFLSNATWLFFWFVIFRQAGGTIGGYDYADICFIWAANAAAYGLSHILFGNIFRLSGLIVSGELDTFLLQPANVLLNTACSGSVVSAYGDFAFGFVMMLTVFPASPAAWAAFLGAMLIGTCIYVGLGLSTHSLTFWLGDASFIGTLAVDMMGNFSMYPEKIYPKIIRIMMYALLPAACISHIPIRVLKGGSPVWIGLWLIVAAAYLTFSLLLFRMGLKKYSSGNQILTRM